MHPSFSASPAVHKRGNPPLPCVALHISPPDTPHFRWLNHPASTTPTRRLSPPPALLLHSVTCHARHMPCLSRVMPCLALACRVVPRRSVPATTNTTFNTNNSDPASDLPLLLPAGRLLSPHIRLNQVLGEGSFGKVYSGGCCRGGWHIQDYT